jgi:hypothetical protein
MRSSWWWTLLATLGCSQPATKPGRLPVVAPSATTATTSSPTPSATATPSPPARASAPTDDGPHARQPSPPNEAEQALLLTVKAARDQQPPDPHRLASALGELASWLITQRRNLEARSRLSEALSLVKDRSLEADRRACQLQIILGESYQSEAEHEQAAEAFRAAISATDRHRTALREQRQEATRGLLSTIDALSRHQDTARALERILQAGDPLPEDAQRLRIKLATMYGSGNWVRAAAMVGHKALVSRRFTVSDATYGDVPPPALSTIPSGGLSVISGSTSNAARVVAGMRAGFRHCYQVGLVTTPSLQGIVHLTIEADDSGVVQVRAIALGLPVSVVDCMLARAGQGRFDTPEGSKLVISVPLTFVVQ